MLETLFPGIALKRERTRRLLAEEIAGRKAAEAMERVIRESTPSFAQDNDEGSWGSPVTWREPLDYTQIDMDNMFAAALELSYHPAGQGLLETMDSFVIGDGPTILPLDESPEVRDYWDDFCFSCDWDNRLGESYRRFLRDGEVFWRWFQPQPGVQSAKGYQHLLARFVEPVEIRDPGNTNNWGIWTFGIQTDLDDIEIPVNYFRYFWKLLTDSSSPQPNWECIPAAEIDHFKFRVDRNIKRGRSWLLGPAKYIRMHEQWLDQRFQLNRLRNLFAVIGNIKGVGGASPADLKAKFADTTGKTLPGQGTLKQMPSNALMLLQKGIDWDLKSLNINAADASEDGRNFQLQIAVGTGLTEPIVRGDASNQNLASSLVAESPMVRMFIKHQRIIRQQIQAVFGRVVRFGINSGQLPETSTRTKEGRIRQAQRRLGVALQEGQRRECKRPCERSTRLTLPRAPQRRSPPARTVKSNSPR